MTYCDINDILSRINVCTAGRPRQRRHSTPSMGGRHDNNLCATRVKSAGNMIGYKPRQGKGVSISIGDIVLLGNQVSYHGNMNGL